MPSHWSRIEGDFPAMERLEDRLLLSAGPVVIGDAAGADAKSLMYWDADGTQVTVALKTGLATVNWGAAGTGQPTWAVNAQKVAVVGSAAAPTNIFLVELAGTSLKSSLTFTTAAPRSVPGVQNFGDAFAQILGGIVAATPVGTISAPKMTIAGGFNNGAKNVAISVTGASTVTVNGVVSGAMDFGGAATDKLSFTANGAVGSSNLTFTGTITSLTLGAGWQSGSVSAAAVSKVTSTGTMGANILAANSVGPVSVTGGDLSGSVTATAGSIGAIAVTAKVTKGHKGVSDTVVGGNLTGAITAGATTGKSIASITVKGGSIGTADTKARIHAGGSIGNISDSAMPLTLWAGEDSFQNWTGSDVEIYVDWSQLGTAGQISSDGGAVDLTVGNSGSLAGVSAKGRTVNDPGQEEPQLNGGQISFTNPDPAGTTPMVQTIGPITATGGDVYGTLNVGQVKGKSITSITDTGGIIGGGTGFAVTADGSVGNISSTGVSFRQSYLDPDTNATKFYNNYEPGGLNITLTVDDGTVGNVTVTGGDAAGTITANGVDVGNITVKGVLLSPPAALGLDTQVLGGGSTLAITADKIGALALTGGNLEGSLTAPLIGAISCTMVMVNATHGGAASDPVDGLTFGGDITTTLTALGTGAKVGAITCAGGTMTLEGQVGFDPATLKLVSKGVTYVSAYTWQDSGCTGGWCAERTTMGGGPDFIVNNVVLA